MVSLHLLLPKRPWENVQWKLSSPIHKRNKAVSLHILKKGTGPPPSPNYTILKVDLWPCPKSSYYTPPCPTLKAKDGCDCRSPLHHQTPRIRANCSFFPTFLVIFNWKATSGSVNRTILHPSFFQQCCTTAAGRFSLVLRQRAPMGACALLRGRLGM